MSTKEVPLIGTPLSGRSAIQTERDKPAFAAVTPGKAAGGAAFGAIGGAIAGAAMVSTGNEIVKDHQVEDPANWISNELAAGIRKKYGTRFVGKRKVTEEKPEEIAKACAGADYALDVRTLGWSLAYFPVNWGTYRVVYSAKLRVIDCRSGKVIAEGFYARVPEKSDQSPSYDGLVKDGAAGLKRELKIGAAEALHHFKQDILKL